MRRVLKGVVIGAVVVGCLASIDGAVLGAVVAGGNEVALTAAWWAIGFAAIGAVLGGVGGGVCGVMGARLVLRPPEEVSPLPPTHKRRFL